MPRANDPACGLNEVGVTWTDRLQLSPGEHSESDDEAKPHAAHLSPAGPRPTLRLRRNRSNSPEQSAPSLNATASDTTLSVKKGVQFREQICDTRLLPTSLQIVSLVLDPSVQGSTLSDTAIACHHAAAAHTAELEYQRGSSTTPEPVRVRPSSSLPLAQQLTTKPHTPIMASPRSPQDSQPATGPAKMAMAASTAIPLAAELQSGQASSVDRKPKRSSSRANTQQEVQAASSAQQSGNLKFPKIGSAPESTRAKKIGAKHCAMFVRKSFSFEDQAVEDRVRLAYFFNSFGKGCRRQRQGDDDDAFYLFSAVQKQKILVPSDFAFCLTQLHCASIYGLRECHSCPECVCVRGGKGL